MGVDNTTVLPSGSQGRKSIWITSKKAFLKGLLIADFAHMPGSNCGTWPALYVFLACFRNLPYIEANRSPAGRSVKAQAHTAKSTS
jgi:hypothetical protein